MKQVRIELTNCYGIRHLKTEFDFSKSRVYAIYAPNGAMKSSFARTFKDYADGAPSRDRIFPKRQCIRTIIDESGAPIPQGSVYVVSPYDEVLGHTEKTAILLVNDKLRREYEQLNQSIVESESVFLAAMKEQSKSKKDLKREISLTFTRDTTQNSFFLALTRIRDEVINQKDAPWADIRYDTIFDDKVLALLANKDVKTAIGDYVARLNELLEASTYFKKGVFNYYNAAMIAKSLADHGFFAAKHTVRLNATDTIEITNRQQLEELIKREKDEIAKDSALRKRYAEIAKLLEKNAECRDFEAYLADHEEILPKLENFEALREEIWKSYFKAKCEQYMDVVAKYQKAQARRREIEEQAAKERSQWESVIEIFNDRFSVPFTLDIKNRIAVTLGYEKALKLEYKFHDGIDNAPVDRDTLLQTLSTGEKKALYVLNIIFEVESRKAAGTETIFVFDDIADSFDYKNKFAIIQYLHDIKEETCFRQIILTHNFDFFRTVNSRFVPYSCCRMAFKDSKGLTIEQADCIKNVFVNDWKTAFFSDDKKMVACIPFIRNIIEYTNGSTDPDYSTLTALLHWKDADSASITRSDLHAIFRQVFGTTSVPASSKGTTPVVDIIEAEAKKCLKAQAGLNLDNKVVLAIATRLTAEKFMIQRINDPAFFASITANQTTALLSRFRAGFSHDVAAIQVLHRVVLMTPENIHLNSFMYEPLLDMSDEHLRKLYADVTALK